MHIQFRHLAAAGAVAAIFGAPAAAADETNPASTNWAGVFGGAYLGPYAVPYADSSSTR